MITEFCIVGRRVTGRMFTILNKNRLIISFLDKIE